MRFDVKTDDFNMVANGIGDDAARAVTGAMDEIAGGLKDDLRGQVTQAGLGARLANTWQARRYPAARASVDAAAYVWSKAPKLITAFDKGVTIRSSRGVFLAIPTPAAGLRGLGRERVTPGGWERRTGLRLRFVYRRLGPSLLVADDAANPALRAAPCGAGAVRNICASKAGRPS